jgi:hypothetical protein
MGHDKTSHVLWNATCTLECSLGKSIYSVITFHELLTVKGGLTAYKAFKESLNVL